MTPPVDGSDRDGESAGAGMTPAQIDELFAALADERRRIALRCLRRAGGSAPFDDLVDDVSRETAAERGGYNRRRDVATSLYHVHLPKLAAADLVAAFDPQGTVSLGERADAVPGTVFDAG